MLILSQYFSFVNEIFSFFLNLYTCTKHVIEIYWDCTIFGKDFKKMFWEKFSLLCAQKGVSPNAAAKELSIASGTITEWKKGRTPNNVSIKKIANYFGVSPVSLIKEDEPPLTSSTLQVLDSQNVHMIPLFENVSAGFGSLAVDHVIDYVPLYFTGRAEAENTICIRVRGDSMYPIIDDGDIIQVHKQTSVDSGSIAVVILDEEEGLVKKVVYGKDWIELHSFNPMYKTMRFNGPEVLRIRVVGLVKKVTKEV